MDINSGITNVVPVDVKSQGGPAVQEGQKNKVDGAVVAKLEAAKQKEVTANKEVTDKKEVSSDELKVSVAKINDYLKADHRDLAFSIHEESGREVVSILDTVSKEVIKQYPTEEVLELSVKLGEFTESGVTMEQAFNIFTSEA